MILTIQSKQQNAFSLITTIFVIVLMAMVGSFILNLSGKIVQETSAQFRKEQAILYAKSYTEMAIMAATSTNCVKKITGEIGPTAADVRQGRGYHAEVYIKYVGNNSVCPNKLTNGNIDYTNSKENIILIDTYIRYRDPDHPNAINSVAWSVDKGYTYHRRTLQKL